MGKPRQKSMSTVNYAPHVAIYTRISQDRGAEAVGIGRQRADSLAVAASRWPDTPVHLYEDNDTSAYTAEDRPAFTALCDAIRDRRAVAVVAWNLDRLLRRPRQLEDVIELCDDAKMPNFVTAQGDLDLTTHDGQLMARVLVAVAKKASDDTSRRVKRAATQRREQGRFHGGKLPWGVIAWDADTPVTDPRAVALAHEAAQRVYGPEPWHVIHADIARRDPTTPGTPKGLRHALMTGPLLDPTTRDAMVLFFTNPDRRSHDGSTRSAHWLNGLLFCGAPGCTGRCLRKNVRGRQRWHCRDGLCVSAPADVLADTVRDVLFAAVQVCGVAPWQRPPEPVLPPGATDAVQRLNDLAEMYVSGELTRDMFKAAKARVERDMAAVVTAPARDASQGTTGSLAARWPYMDVHEQHRNAAQVFDRIVLMPATRRGRQTFDPARLRYETVEGVALDGG